MSRLQIALLICASLVGLTLWALRGPDEVQLPQQLERSTTNAPLEEALPEANVFMEREDARGFEPASLRVIAKNPTGVQLADAQITLAQEDESTTLTGTGSHHFSTLAPGSWIVRVEHPEFIEHIETIELAPGASEQLNINLYPDLRITGTITDRFGRKQVGQYIWFLKPGEQYPERMRRASKLFGGQVNANGTFEAQIPADLPLQMVVGLPGRPRWKDRTPITLSAGDPQHLDLVIGGTTLTKVVVLGANLERSERRSMFSIGVQASKKAKPGRNDTLFMQTYDIQTRRQIALAEQTRRRQEARTARKQDEAELQQDGNAELEPDALDEGPRGGRLKKKRQERLKERKERIAAGLAPDPGQTSTTSLPPAPPNQITGDGSGLVWNTVRSEVCPASGELSFHNLPLNQDLRLRVDRRVESLTSDIIFRAREDVTLVLEFTMPNPKSERPAGTPTPPLFFSTRMENLPKDAPRAGATWSH